MEISQILTSHQHDDVSWTQIWVQPVHVLRQFTTLVESNLFSTPHTQNFPQRSPRLMAFQNLASNLDLIKVSKSCLNLQTHLPYFSFQSCTEVQKCQGYTQINSSLTPHSVHERMSDSKNRVSNWTKTGSHLHRTLLSKF